MVRNVLIMTSRLPPLFGLFQAQARSALVHWLVGKGNSGTVSELARLAGVTPRAARVEVAHLQELGLVRVEVDGAADRVNANTRSPLFSPLRALCLAAEKQARAKGRRETLDHAALRETLVYFGAPFTHTRAKKHMRLEVAVVEALTVAHSDATLLRVLPVVLARSVEVIDWERLKALARRGKRKAELGMLLEIPGTILNLPVLMEHAVELRDARVKSLHYFHPPRNKFEEELIAKNTPPFARKWGFLLNMGEDSFRSILEKHVPAT